MKEWREYISENLEGHWLILSEAEQPEKPDDLISKDGGQAVIGMRRKPGEYVSVNILSASKEIDTVTGKLGREKDFYIMLECLRDGSSCISNKTYNADEALQLARLFLGQTKQTAMKIWNLKKLGSENNRIDY